MQGQQEMEDTLTEQLQQDWVIAEEATEWVGSHLDGWRELLARMGLEANTMTVGCPGPLRACCRGRGSCMGCIEGP